MAVLVSHPDEQLLSWCALLQTPDADALCALAECEQERVALFLMSGVLQVDRSGASHLRRDLRRAALQRLRDQSPHEEVARHTAALHFFAERLVDTYEISQTARSMNACLYHLTAMHDLAIEAMEWNFIIPHLDRVRKILATSARHLHWLTFFEAYAQLRMDRASAGLEQMEQLRAIPEIEPALRMRALHACSIPYADDGRHIEALQHCEEAIPIAHVLGDRRYEGYLLLSIGMIQYDLEDYRRAVEYCEQALTLFREAGDPRREATTLYEIGNNMIRLGEWQLARTALAEAQRAFERLALTRRLAMACWAHGVALLMVGDPACEVVFQRAITIARNPEYRIANTERDALARLGLFYQSKGRYREACDCFRAALQIAKRDQQRHYQAIYQYRLADALRRCGQIQAAQDAYQHALAGIEGLRAATDIAELKQSILGTTQYIFESAVLFELEHGSPARALAIVEQSRARALLDLMLQQLPNPTPDADLPTLTLAEIQQHLAEHDLLLEYFTAGMLPIEDHLLHQAAAHNPSLYRELVPTPAILLFAITCNSVEVHRLQIDPNTLRPSAYASDPVLQTMRSTSRMRWLSEQLIRPVEHLISACTQLYIAPHGPLHYIPFAALTMADQSYLLRARGPALALVPSATFLIRNCLVLPRQRATGGLAIGYNAPIDQPLEHAEAEAHWVAQVMGGEVWAGSGMKSERLIARGPQIGWLHIAGHATYNEHMSLTSSLQLGEADALEAGRIMTELHLHADLVTLSSCRSGLSRVVPGDELLGLQRAFLYAGTPTVVCTQARTHDTIAFLIMDQFYRSLRAGMAAAAALRDAQVAVREMSYTTAIERLAQIGIMLESGGGDEFEQPFAAPEYWAPFVLIGRP